MTIFNIKKAKIRTWSHLFERLGRQSLSNMKDARIMMKKEDGTFCPLGLHYNETGSYWWFEEIKNESKEDKEYEQV